MQAFVVRPFGTKEGINFGTIHEELIKKALKTLRSRVTRPPRSSSPATFARACSRVSMANYKTRLNTLTWEVL